MIKRIAFDVSFCLLLLVTLASCGSSGSSKEEEIPYVSYVADIEPIMKRSCTPCHYPEKGQKKMLDTYGAVASNFNAILFRVQLPTDDKEYMPFKGKRQALTEDEILMFKDWKRLGMPKE